MTMTRATASFALAVVGLIGAVASAQSNREANVAGATQAQFEQWMTELSTWHRWGRDDQLGSANLITPAKRLQAASLVETGETVSLGHDVADDIGSDANRPFALDMIISFDPDRIRDRVDIDYHGGFFTHLDALCHVVYDGKIYNGHDFRDTVTADGCAQLGITGLKYGVVTKAVLIDVPRLRGVPYLEPGTRVYREDIEAWERQTGVRVEPGDVLLIRTGRWARRDVFDEETGTAGMDASFLPFLAERDVALLGGDTAHEVRDNIPGFDMTVVHKFTIVARGMNLLDNLDLEEVAETAARLQRWEFLFMASPVRVPHGTGSPINPIAMFAA
jgi:kynurenine formamidase